MIFCVDNLRNVLHNISDCKLKKISNECYASFAIGINAKNEVHRNINYLFLKFKSMKQWTANQFVENGQKYIFSAMDCVHSGKYRDEIRSFQWPHILFIAGSAFSLIPKQHKNVILFYVLSIVSYSDLYDRIIFLRALSNECFEYKEYLIGYRVLRSAYKLCGKYMLPTFVNVEYKEKKKDIIEKLVNIKCSGCNRKGMALRCCKGCMKTFYCSKRCQKLHWRKVHRKNVNLFGKETTPKRSKYNLYTIIKQ